MDGNIYFYLVFDELKIIFFFKKKIFLLFFFVIIKMDHFLFCCYHSESIFNLKLTFISLTSIDSFRLNLGLFIECFFSRPIGFIAIEPFLPFLFSVMSLMLMWPDDVSDDSESDSLSDDALLSSGGNLPSLRSFSLRFSVLYNVINFSVRSNRKKNY